MKVRTKLIISLKLRTLNLVAVAAIIVGAFGFGAGPAASVDLNFHGSYKNVLNKTEQGNPITIPKNPKNQLD